MLDFGPGSFFLTPSQLSDSPSSRHGIPSTTEKALRLYACEIIQEAGILLRLPQAVAATAQVLLHRFFCKQSFRDFDARSAAASCFWLSMKLEEEEGASNRGRKRSHLNDVVAMFENIRARREGDLPLLQHSAAFKRRKEELLKLETRILVELGFVCHVEHPHKILLGYLNCLGSSRELVQEAWNMVNDSLRTTLCVSFSSNVIACGVIYAAACRLSVSLPENPPWWLLFDVTFDEILEICHTLADLYRQPKSQYIDVSQLCKTLVVLPSSEASPVNTAKLALPPLSESLPVTTESIPVVEEHGDATDCRKDVSVVSLSSASKVLNSCFVNALGLPLSKGVFVGGIVVAHQLQQSQPDGSKKKTSRDVTSEVENKDVKLHLSSRRRSHECLTSKRDYRDMEGSYKHSYREPEHKHRRRGDYSSFHERLDICSSRVEACCHNSYSSLLVKFLLGDIYLSKRVLSTRKSGPVAMARLIVLGPWRENSWVNASEISNALSLNNDLYRFSKHFPA